MLFCYPDHNMFVAIMCINVLLNTENKHNCSNHNQYLDINITMIISSDYDDSNFKLL